MKYWNRLPPVFQKNFLVSLALIVLEAIITAAAYLFSKDTAMLLLGIVLVGMSLIKSLSCCVQIVTNRYETFTGICTNIKRSPLHRHKTVLLESEDQTALSIKLQPNQRMETGTAYLLYLRAGTKALISSKSLYHNLITDQLLAFEKTPDTVPVSHETA